MAAQVIANSIVLGLTLALMAIGLTLIYGILMVVNFAHGEFYMLGGVALYYVMSATEHGLLALRDPRHRRRRRPGLGPGSARLPPLPRRPHRRVHRRHRPELGIQSIAWEVFGPRTRTVRRPGARHRPDPRGVVSSERLLIAIVSLVTILALAWFIKYAKLGKAMRAVSAGQRGRPCQGIPAERISAMAFGIATALAALAGVLVAPQTFVNPAMGSIPLMFAFIVVIIGGMGSVMGSFLASMIIGFQQNLTTLWWGSQYSIGVAFLLAIVVLIMRPKGLMGHD